MKHNKTLGILSVALVLGLVGCAGNKGTSTKSNAKTSKTSKPSVSTLPPEPVKEVMAEEAILVKGTDNKVYFQVSGTYDLYNAGDLKLAWGLVGQNQTWYAGAETPEAADYKADGVTLDATTKTFTAKFCITDIAGLGAQTLYSVYVGTEEDTGMMYAEVPVTDTTLQLQDTKYTYYIRNDDGSAGVLIAIEEAAAIQFSGAKVEALTGDHEGTWLTLSAANTAGYTVESLQETYTLVADWQRMAAYQKTALTEDQKFWEISGSNVLLHLSVGHLGAGYSYMAHFGLKGETDPGKLILTDSIMDVEYTIGTMKYTIHFDKTKGQNDGEAEYYGSLGIVVEDLSEPVTEE